jgi:hypothetical protein
VPPGRYRIAPYVSADDKAKGLVVAPTHVDLSVVGEPVHDLQFGQAKLALHGSVSCLDGPCPDDVMVVVHVASTGTKVMSGQLGNIPADGHNPPGVFVWGGVQRCRWGCHWGVGICVLVGRRTVAVCNMLGWLQSAVSACASECQLCCTYTADAHSTVLARQSAHYVGLSRSSVTSSCPPY